MSYVVLARRYRPKNFDQIIGQEHISRTLKNAISENRVAHAYLFSGPRGVGKTTSARILAKALNCKQGPREEPCDECPNCQEITTGSSIDVQEIDGASNRGIDEIRSLRENVKFSPACSKYKIYIIDEAHQITDAAFNALLKTLEEPPPHVIFILATTEPQKIPITILSRCQRYRFRLLSSKEIMSTLENLVKTENFQIDQEALTVITNSSGGSLRDALSLLDQAVSYVSGKVTLNDMQNLLGFLPQEIIYETSEVVSKTDSSKILNIIKNVTEQGYSLLQFARDLREHLRRLLLVNINDDLLDITYDEKKKLEEQKSYFAQGWLIRSGHLLSKALDEMRWSDQPRLILELYLLHLSQPYASIDELMARLDNLEKGVEKQLENDVESPDNIVVKSTENTAAEDTTAGCINNNFADSWKQVVDELKSQRPRIGNILQEAELKNASGNGLLISVSNKFLQDGIKREQALIETIITKKFGKQLNLQVSIEEKPKKENGEEEIVVPEEQENVKESGEVYKVEEDLSERKETLPQGLDKILNKFPGKVTKKRQLK